MDQVSLSFLFEKILAGSFQIGYTFAVIMSRRRNPPQQLELAPRSKHGGRRPGAGRPRIHDPGREHRRRPSLSPTVPLHVTLRMEARVYNLRSDRSFRVIERALLAATQRDDARIVHFSVQGNHIHMLVEADERRALSSAMRSLAIRIGLGMNRLMRSSGKVIAHRYHARQLRTPTEVYRALGYVRRNHSHHARRLGRPVATSVDRYSSDSEHVFAAPAAKTWLLSIGWQKSPAARTAAFTRCDES